MYSFLTSTVDVIVLEGLQFNDDAEMNLAKTLLMNLISSFELIAVERKDDEDKDKSINKEDYQMMMKESARFSIVTRYKSGRGKLLFGLVTDSIVSAAASYSQTQNKYDSSMFFIVNTIHQLIQNLDFKSTLTFSSSTSALFIVTLAKSVYEIHHPRDTGLVSWSCLPLLSKEIYATTLKNILLQDLQYILRDVTRSFQSLSDFDTLWVSCCVQFLDSETSSSLLTMSLYAYTLTSILNIIGFLEKEHANDSCTTQNLLLDNDDNNSNKDITDDRYYNAINIAASILFLQHAVKQKTISKKRNHGMLSSSMEDDLPDATLTATKTLDKKDDGSSLTFSSSTALQFIACLVHKLLLTDNIFSTYTPLVEMKEQKQILQLEKGEQETMIMDKHVITVIELIESQRRRIETRGILPDMDLMLTPPNSLWNSVAASDHDPMMSLNEIYYGFIDRVFKEDKEILKCVDDIIIRAKLQGHRILPDASSLSTTNTVTVTKESHGNETNVTSSVKIGTFPATQGTSTTTAADPADPVVPSTTTSSGLVVDKKAKTTGARKSTSSADNEKAYETFTKGSSVTSSSIKSITLSMELGEWASLIISIASSSRPIRPTGRVDTFFQSLHNPTAKDIMISALNDSLHRLIHYMKGPSSDNQTYIESSGLMKSSATKNHELTADIFLRGIVFLFYYILEAILVFEAARLKIPLPKLLESRPFYNGVFTFSCLCLYRATGGPLSLKSKSSIDDDETFICDNLDPRSILTLFQCSICDYLRVSEVAVRSLVCFDRPLKKDSSNRVENSIKIMKQAVEITNKGLPTILMIYLRQEENFLLESHLWASRSMITESPEILWDVIHRVGSLCQCILDVGSRNKSFERNECESLDIFPDYSFVKYIIRRVLIIASKRVIEFLPRLSVSTDSPLAIRVWETFLHVLRHEIQLLRDRHVDQIILCIVYGVSKVLKYTPTLTFVHILREYYVMRKNDIGESGCDKIVRDVRMNHQGSGDIIEFYNIVFIPVMKNYLVNSTQRLETFEKVSDTVKEGTLNVTFTVKGEKMAHKSPGAMVHCHAFGSVAHFHQNKMNS